MFESAEIGHKIDKNTYKVEEPVLREALLDIHKNWKNMANFPWLF